MCIAPKEVGGLLPPTFRQNPLLRLLQPNNQDQVDKENLRLPAKEQLFAELVENPEKFKKHFENLSKRNQNGIETMVVNSGKSSNIMNILKTMSHPAFVETKDFRKHRNDNDERDKENLSAPKYRQNPLLRPLAPHNKDTEDKHNFSPPDYKQNPLLRQLVHEPENFKENFLELPKQDQETLMEIIKNETDLVDQQIWDLKKPKKLDQQLDENGKFGINDLK